ncbi:MAG TPA: hypothetical protein VJR29_07980 [bacterium]|nr:hypothetical protein [bacterium]
MDRQIFEIQIVDYLEGELSPADLAEFKAALQQNPDWRLELESFGRLRDLYREKLPSVTAPAGLAERALARLPKPERKRWAFFGMGAFWRPVLTGAFVLAFTLVGTYEYKRWRDTSLPVAKAPVAAPAPSETVAVAAPARNPDFGEPSFAPSRIRPYRAPAWRSNPNPRLAGGGQVSLASFGSGASSFDMGGSADIYSLEQEAQLGLAQFLHQQALRMNGLGDHQGAAEAIAELVQKYPSYPRIFEAMALRIGCLFQLGQIQKAEQELTWLRQNSPGLADLVEQRWKGNTTPKNSETPSFL